MKITMNMKMRIFDGLYLQKVLFNIWKYLKDFKNVYCKVWHVYSCIATFMHSCIFFKVFIEFTQ